MITQELVKDFFNYDHNTGIITHKQDKGSNKVEGSRAESKGVGCLTVSINDKNYVAHVIAWLWYYGYIPENFIDHIDRDCTNNKISNLREVTNKCNQRNTGNPKDNTSGVKGVYWHKAKNNWKAEITNNGRLLYLGSYTSFEDAVCARLAGEQCLDWVTCDSISPAFLYVHKLINT